MKRVLILLLVLSLVLWTAGTALAAGFPDTAGTRYEDAVNLMSTLGLLTGFPDGTFRPGDTLTRAQFCAMAVRSLGLESAGDYAAGVQVFPDVPPTHWAAGYINIAADQGIAKGFPDGTFRPEAPVTYAEALAMLVRVLGYEPAISSIWPTNYLVKAFALGISEGVSFPPGAHATRGDVALFVLNCLGINLMEQVAAGDEVQYAVVDKTLLDSRLGFEVITGWVEETGDALETLLAEDEVEIDGEVYDLSEGLDAWPFLGLEVKAWLDGEAVLWMEQLTDEDHIFQDRIAEVETNGHIDITLEELDEEFELDPGAIVYFDLIRLAAGDVDPFLEGADVTVVIEDGDIVTLLATMYEGSVVVTSVDLDDEEIEVLTPGATEEDLDLSDFYEVILLKDGAEVDLDEMQVWDVAHVAFLPLPSGPVLLAELVDDKVSGELEEIGADADDNMVLTIDGEEYEVADEATRSSDDNESFEVVDDDTMEAFAGEDVTVYLDKWGDVRHVVAGLEEEEAPPSIGMVVRASGDYWYSWGPPGDEQYYVKLLTPDGKVTRYEWDDETSFVGREFLNEGGVIIDGDEMTGGLGDLNDGFYNGTVVEFSLTGEGLLDTVTELDFEAPGWSLEESDIDADHDVIDLGGTKYKVTGGTVLFDECEGDEDVYAWESFQDIDIADNDIAARMFRDGNATIDVLVVDSEGEALTFPGIADVGVVLKRVVTGDGTAYKILVGDQSDQYLAEEADIDSLAEDNWGTAGSSFSRIGAGDLVSFGIDTAGEEFTEIEELDAWYGFDADGDWGDEDFYYAWINEGGIDPANLILSVRCAEDKDAYDEDDLQIVLTNDTVIYDVTGSAPEMAEFGDLEEDQCIQFFDLDGDGLIDYLKITESTD